jgi:hypothetical protein
MKKKKNLLYYEENYEVLLEQDQVNIKNTQNEIYFQIGYQITNDVAEAVSIMMKILDDNDPIWNIRIKNKNINTQSTLYWLSGGDDEWLDLKHYNQPWNECYDLYEKEFGKSIHKIINESISLRDIRNEFKNNFNMFKMYDFALSINLIK